MGQAPDLMTNPQMAALVAPIDAAVLFPFYAEVNINTAKFRWYKTGQLETKPQSFYAVPVCALLSCDSILVRSPLVPQYLPSTFFDWCCFSAHS